MKKLIKKALIPIFALPLLLLFSGCDKDPESETISVQFRFNSGSDLKPGSRVVYLGTIVGQVPSAPEVSKDAQSVIVTARLNQLPDHLRPLVNQSMTAQIVRDDIITGGRQLKLHFSSRSDSLPLTEETMLLGVNNFIELEAWKALNSGDGNGLERLAGYVFKVNAGEIGTWMRYANLGSFILLVLLILSTLVHKFTRTLFKSTKRNSKPFLWKLVFILTSVRIIGVAAVFIFASIGNPIPSAPPFILLPDSPITLLQWEWRPILFSLFVLGLGLTYWIRSCFRKQED